MGIKKLKNILLKPHHIAFSGLTILILIGVAWYFYSSRRMEGFKKMYEDLKLINKMVNIL